MCLSNRRARLFGLQQPDMHEEMQVVVVFIQRKPGNLIDDLAFWRRIYF